MDLLARLAGHFLDVVEGPPTPKIFRRSLPQERVIAEVTEQHRVPTMRTLRTAFLPSFVLELAAAAGRALNILGTAVSDPAAADTPASKTQAGTGPAPCDSHGTIPDLRSTTISLKSVGLLISGRSQPALSGVDLEIRPGERIVITGRSGAGQSSLLALLLRLAGPSSGRIEAGRTDLAAIPAGLWRRQLAWVPQQPYLSAGTNAENIALGRIGC